MTLSWVAFLLLLFLYSFTQIDLGLTLTQASWWQTVQKNFQFIGYFKRPLSTGLYLAILFFLFGFYFLFIKKVKNNQLTSQQVWRLIFLTAGILWFAYNAFSYDLFNYIFDAKIVTFYRQNPYQHKALDYLGDPMLGFMHWTHRLYPYGPTWLALTVPLSFLAWQKLIPNMILMKGLVVTSYLVSCWLIEKILVKTNPRQKMAGLTLFAFSPLIVIEGLVSAHNDLPMMMLALAGFWFLIQRRPWLAWLMLLLSVGVKFATVLLIPVFIWLAFQQKQKRQINWEKVWLMSFLMMIPALLAATKRTNLQPWYLLYFWPFVSLMTQNHFVFWLSTGFALGLLLNYAPFLYLGNWNPPVPAIKLGLTLSFLGLGLIFFFFRKKINLGFGKRIS